MKQWMVTAKHSTVFANKSTERFKQSTGALKHTSSAAKQSMQSFNKTSVTVKQIVGLEVQTSERGNRNGQFVNQKCLTVPRSIQLLSHSPDEVKQRNWRQKKFGVLLNHITRLVAQTLATATQSIAPVNKFACEAHHNNLTSNQLTRLVNHTHGQVTHFASPDRQTARPIHLRNALTS